MDDLTRLLIEARDGNRSAFTSFAQRTEPEIRRLCAYLVDRSDADDATQETYFAAWRALPSYRAEASARTWLFVIARRSAGRVVRRRRKWSELSLLVPPPSATPHPESNVELHELLGSLDFDRRAALVLTQIIGLSYTEAAEACECPIGTIRSRVARAREQLIGSQTQSLAELTTNQGRKLPSF